MRMLADGPLPHLPGFPSAGLARPARCGLTRGSRIRPAPNIRRCAAIQRRLSPAEVEALIADYEGGGRVGELARMYGIHRTKVSAHMSRAGKTRGQLTASYVDEGGAAL